MLERRQDPGPEAGADKGRYEDVGLSAQFATPTHPLRGPERGPSEGIEDTRSFVFPDACIGEGMSEDYGDRVTSLSQDGFVYGGSLGMTPNITVEYGPPGRRIDLWLERFGDLEWAAINNNDIQDSLIITLSADPGFVVLLDSFDLARINILFGTFPPPPFIAVFVLDVNGTPVFSTFDLEILNETTHTDVDFATPLSSERLVIQLDMTSLGIYADLIAIDNVVFGQSALAVPEPPASLALALSLVVLLLGRAG